MPKHVVEFINSLDFSNNKNTYFFGIATNGGIVGNGIRQLREVLRLRNLRLHYGNDLKSPDNYIFAFDMNIDFLKYEIIYNNEFPKLLKDIKTRKVVNISRQIPLVTTFYKNRIKNISSLSKNYNVNNDCISCGICKIVCPVNNIEISNTKPTFLDECEQCTGCIQFCPTQAINYKNKTINKGRYIHPYIDYKLLKDFYKKDLVF